ncbi:MAG: CHAT domain-containing protein [Stigonema ocellatum SAG 48.90 = DSM 106950]|nr:CHAT domain-containing protein [Stigonema ocellatum SAG 48.90 = DSM 106950]
MKNRSRVGSFHRILFLCSLVFCLWLSQFGQIVTAQSPDASQLVEQGITLYKAGDFRGAIASWQASLNLSHKTNNRANEAIVNENLARVYQQLGQSQEAISHWEQVIAYYRASGNIQQLGRILTEEAQTYSNLGQPRKAIALLCGDVKSTKQAACLQGSALHIARKQQDLRGEIAALGSLGEAYRLRGNYDEAIKYLQQAKEINEPTYQWRVLNSLGNVYNSKAQIENLRANSAEKLEIPNASEFKQQASDHYKKAWESFQMSLQLARKQDDQPGEMQTLLNLIQLSSHFQKQEASTLASIKPQSSVALDTQFDALVQDALTLLDKLPNSPHKVYAAIDLANLPVNSVNITSPIIPCSSKRRLPDSQAKELLLNAVKTAQTFKDPRSESFALGVLGHFYECTQEYPQALELTNKALWAADQNLKAQDSVYLWEWQAGRLLQTQGKQERAMAAYQRAYSTLEQIRSDILLTERDLQFNFRDIIQPLYRELAQLSLELAYPATFKGEKRNKELAIALKTIDSLKLAELQNYFGNDCILTAINEKSVDELLGNDTAVFSSIILDKGIAILLSLPNGEKRFEWLKKNSATIIEPANVIKEIEQFRDGLVHGRVDIIYNTTLAGKLYDSIIRPFEKDLNPKQIKTLVFIQDGILRTVPMAALYDTTSKQFLVEKYAIATSPSISLTTPKKLNSKENLALILGLTKEAKVDNKVYPILTNVPSEIEAVQHEFPRNKPLVDLAFNPQSVEKELKQTAYPIIHIATHAQFGIIPEDTFIVTGESNGKITINELEKQLRQVNSGSSAVELLALTACETALGDDRATLGLAGVALQAGVRSTLASLWPVSDESTPNLVTKFYASLKSGMSKAEALRASQRKLINGDDKYSNPAYWAPFILIGNWL